MDFQKFLCYSRENYLFFAVCRFIGIIRNLFLRFQTPKEVIVSLTSYPARIDNLQPTLDSIFQQTHKPDKIVLWLAESEFTRKEEDLPAYLNQLAKDGKIIIEWCHDLKPHKKYFYALQKYKNSIVITIDDDLLFNETMIERLLASYAKFPHAISAMRTHLMRRNKDKFAKYNQFIKEQNLIVDAPSMLLLSTNGAGSLFPPNIFKQQYFDEELIKKLCLYTDDLWIKAMSVLSGAPVVQIPNFNPLKVVKKSQQNALYKENVQMGGNDVCLENICQWANQTFPKGYFMSQIFNTKYCNALFKKFAGHKTLLYFVPHQDDELLTMGIDICTSVFHKKDVHVILCTDGSKSKVIKRINDQKKCPFHAGTHAYNLSESAFSRARDAEFKDSCRALGVPEDNIHILSQRAIDGSLTVEFAEDIMCQFLDIYGARATFCTIYHDNGETQHRDHKALGFAAANLFQTGKIKKLRFFCEPYHIQNTKGHFIIKRAAKDLRPKLNKALKAYAYWNPKQKRYAVGYHSVTKDMDNLRKDMKTYFFKMTRGK